jgi:hypothetical protein
MQIIQHGKFLINSEVQKSGAFAGAEFFLSANISTALQSPLDVNELNSSIDRIVDTFNKVTGFNGNTYKSGAGFSFLMTSTTIAMTFDHDKNSIISTRINDRVYIGAEEIGNSIQIIANQNKSFSGIDLLTQDGKSFINEPSGTALVFGADED